VSRQSRLIVVLLVMAALGVAGLSIVANQYRRALSRSRDAGGAAGTPSAARRVDAFLVVRQAMREAASLHPKEARDRCRSARARALAAQGVTPADYAQVRDAWRALAAGRAVDDPALARELRSRPMVLAEGALGPLESLDDGSD
jgi:hypothetical protein